MTFRATDMGRLAERLGTRTTCGFLFEEGTTMNSVEYLIHEIGHALSVHVKPFAAVFVDGLPRRRMSTVVAAILRRRSDEGVHNECLVLAAEAVKASTTWRSRIVRSHPSPLCQSRPL